MKEGNGKGRIARPRPPARMVAKKRYINSSLHLF